MTDKKLTKWYKRARRLSKKDEQGFGVWVSSSFLIASNRLPELNHGLIVTSNLYALLAYLRRESKLSHHIDKSGWIDLKLAQDLIKPLLGKNHLQFWDEALSNDLIKVSGKGKERKVQPHSYRRSFHFFTDLCTDHSPQFERTVFATAMWCKVPIYRLINRQNKADFRANLAVAYMQAMNAMGNVWSQRQFADILGVSEKTIRNYQERGRDSIIHQHKVIDGSPTSPDWPIHLRPRKYQNSGFMPNPELKQTKELHKKCRELWKVGIPAKIIRVVQNDNVGFGSKGAYWTIGIQAPNLHRPNLKKDRVVSKRAHDAINYHGLSKLSSARQIRQHWWNYRWEERSVVPGFDRTYSTNNEIKFGRKQYYNTMQKHRIDILKTRAAKVKEELKKHGIEIEFTSLDRLIRRQTTTYIGNPGSVTREYRDSQILSFLQREGAPTEKWVVAILAELFRPISWRPMKPVKSHRSITTETYQDQDQEIQYLVTKLPDDTRRALTRVLDPGRTGKIREKVHVRRRFSDQRTRYRCISCGCVIPNKPHPESYTRCPTCLSRIKWTVEVESSNFGGTEQRHIRDIKLVEPHQTIDQTEVYWQLTDDYAPHGVVPDRYYELFRSTVNEEKARVEMVRQNFETFRAKAVTVRMPPKARQDLLLQ